MWTYVQKTGELLLDGHLVATGYSGHGSGKNNPDQQDIHSVGPIPQGSWTIEGPPYDAPTHGPYVLRLAPCEGTQTYGRSGFLMHGDMANPALAGTASLGCIIMPRDVRETVWMSGDCNLEVVAELAVW